MSQSKDSAVIKALSELGIREDPELSPEQEEMFNSAVNHNTEEQFLDDVKRLFSKDPTS